MNADQISKLKKQASNFIYAYIEDSDLNSGVFGKYSYVLAQKKKAELAYLKALSTLWGVDRTELLEIINQGLKETYRELKTPTGFYQEATAKLILYNLALGNPIKGINWQKGIFGVSEASENFTKNISGVTVNNPMKGDLKLTSGGILYGNDIYDGGKLVGKTYYDSKGNAAYSSLYDANTNTFDLSTVTTKEAVTFAKNGKILKNEDLGYWNNVCNVMTIVSDFVQQLINLLTGGINAQTITPVQSTDGWYEKSSTPSIGTAGLVAAGLIVGGIVLSNQDKDKISKSKNNRKSELIK